MTAADTRLGLLLDEYLDRAARGETPDPEEFAGRVPELADTFRRLAAALALLPAAGADPAPALAGFRVVREVGRGGMGVVFEAVEEALGRRVALKTLPAQATAHPTALDRFRREAKAAARLHHTHIVPVFGVGEQNGVHYYAMQFVEGESLAAALARRAGPPGAADVPAAARLGRALAGALAYAHAQGVFHRDVKPGNVLLAPGPGGEAVPYLADFGLAKLAGDDDLTGTGDFVGTLRYAAPEQLRGTFDARGDVYGLGVTLYELLAGRPALDAPDRDGLLRQLAGGDPPPVRRFNPAVPRDLETVVMKAAAKEPAARYATATDLAADLGRFLAGEAVAARRVGPVGRGVRWARRNQVVAGLLAGVLLLLAAVAATATGGYVQTSAALADSEKNLKAADAATGAAKAAQRAEAKERGRAEQGEKDARAAFDRLLVTVRSAHDMVDSMPGGYVRLQAQRLTGLTPGEWAQVPGVVQSGALVRLYETFVAIPLTDPGHRLEQAAAAWRLARLYHELDRLDDAGRAFAAAVLRADELLAAGPAPPRARFERASALAARANFKHWLNGQDVAAEYAAAKDELGRLSAEFPTDPAYPSLIGEIDLMRVREFYISRDSSAEYVAAERWQKKAVTLGDYPPAKARLSRAYRDHLRHLYGRKTYPPLPALAREWADVFPDDPGHQLGVAQTVAHLASDVDRVNGGRGGELWEVAVSRMERWGALGGRDRFLANGLPRMAGFVPPPEFTPRLLALKARVHAAAP